MIKPFHLCCVIVVVGFAAIGTIRHRDAVSVPYPAAVLMSALRSEGYDAKAQGDVLWGIPSAGIAVAGCPTPVDALGFAFDDIVSPGVLPAVTARYPQSMDVSYYGKTFKTLDRWALYRLRFRTGMTELLHSGTWASEPPVILLFYPSSCMPERNL